MFPSSSHRPTSPELAKSFCRSQGACFESCFSKRCREHLTCLQKNSRGKLVCLLSGLTVWFMLCPSDPYKCRGLGDNTVRPSASPDPRMCFLCQILRQKGGSHGMGNGFLSRVSSFRQLVGGSGERGDSRCDSEKATGSHSRVFFEIKAGSSAQAPEAWEEQDPVTGFLLLLPSFPSI